jgi:hypothetical protein
MLWVRCVPWAKCCEASSAPNASAVSSAMGIWRAALRGCYTWSPLAAYSWITCLLCVGRL